MSTGAREQETIYSGQEIFYLAEEREDRTLLLSKNSIIDTQILA